MASKRCVSCGLVNPESAMLCDCGFNFRTGHTEGTGRDTAHFDEDLSGETPEDLRHLHMYRLTMGWFMVVGFIAVVGLTLLTLVLGMRIRILYLLGAAAFGLLAKGIS